MLMRPKEAAAYLKLSAAFLARRRCEKRGPRYVKIGRAVTYRLGDLDVWVAAHIVETDDTRRMGGERP